MASDSSTVVFMLSWSSLLLLLLQVTVCQYSLADGDAERKVYIVYMGNQRTGDSALNSLYLDILKSIVAAESQQNLVVEALLIHSYKRSFTGFSAYLTQEEANKLTGVQGVVSVFPGNSYIPRTTRSWDFIGLPLNVSRRASFESNIIIGVIDTGIWPESESFNDKGIGPPPIKWKGACQSSKHFKCNNKIIGARYYKGNRSSEEQILSPRDKHGHGTHTAATAAGREVVGASMFGIAKGVARGGVPSARIAVYKACWDSNLGLLCAAEDVLAAFDDAIADGVDLLVASIAGSNQNQYFEDAVAIGSFHAMQRGVLTSAPASDRGGLSNLDNYAPWLLTVGASSVDRQFIDTLVLEDGRSYQALQLNSFASHKKSLPLIYGGDASKGGAKFYGELAKNCTSGSLDRMLVHGKIVLCDSLLDGVVVGDAAGFIFPIHADPCVYGDIFKLPLPAICLGAPEYAQLKNDTRSIKNFRGRILQSISIHFPDAPMLAPFSSRGPNLVTMDILKPDVTAPGVDILAAWSPKAKLTTYCAGDLRSSQYNIMSGTSAAAAHAVAIAAYIKTHHPTWSPASIRSALMTTALPLKASSYDTAVEIAFGGGAGHIHVAGVLDPGLVYDAHQLDYVHMLCNQGYTARMLRAVTGGMEACKHPRNGTVWDLNYPSFALVTTEKDKPFNATFPRFVTNVGSPRSTYHAFINNTSADRLEIVVEPKVLSFESLLEKKSFLLHVRGLRKPKGTISASLVWTDGVHHVRSPILAAVGRLVRKQIPDN